MFVILYYTNDNENLIALKFIRRKTSGVRFMLPKIIYSLVFKSYEYNKILLFHCNSI